jgi:hypothetical protein
MENRKHTCRFDINIVGFNIQMNKPQGMDMVQALRKVLNEFYHIRCTAYSPRLLVR